MFKPKNVDVINRYLGLLKQLLNFFDPVLGFYLHQQEFTPNLFAIPWFLTMFSHVFSLNKIFLLWDRLLVKTKTACKTSNEGAKISENTARIFPVYVAVAMLTFISSELKKCDFSQLCQWSSDMQDFDVLAVMLKAEKMFEKSPLSVGNWNDFDQKILEQPVPFISMSKLHSLIIQEAVFKSGLMESKSSPPNLKSASKKIKDKSPVSQLNSIAIIDTRDPIRYKNSKIRFSQNLPFDEEFDFTPSLLGEA